MIIKVRETMSGVEFWDNIKKKITLVPAGQKPCFDFIDNQKSMLYSKLEAEEISNIDDFGDGSHEEVATDYLTMTVKQLTDYAAEHNIDLGTAKKKVDIVKVILDIA